MKKDIENIEDIKLLVNTFYETVKIDPLIGPIFTEIVKVNWDKHLPVMYSFWENALFYTGGYVGNPMKVHSHVHKVAHLSREHFARWTQLFITTVDLLFKGDRAEIAKQRALSISTVLQVKLFGGGEPAIQVKS
jgi:hemoglobin